MGVNNRNMNDSPIMISGIMRIFGDAKMTTAVLDRLALVQIF
jgi:hypothetical protein